MGVKLNESANFLVWCRVAGGVENSAFETEIKEAIREEAVFISVIDLIIRN